jgi:lysophospholipase L1-like esterase
MEQESPTRHKVFMFLVKLAGALLLSLVLWELILSTFYYKLPLSITHPVLGRIYGQGLYVQGKEGFARAHLDALGLRILPPFETQSDAKNVLLLGDSYTQGLQVADKETFAWLLQEQLGKGYKVFNAGREGTSPNYYIGQAEFLKTTFKPDTVVIQLSESDFTHDPFDAKQSLYFVRSGQEFQLIKNDSYKSRSSLGQRFDALKTFLNFSVMRVGLQRLEGKHDRGTEFANNDERSENEKVAEQKLFISFAVNELKTIYGDPILVYIPPVDYFGTSYTKPSAIERDLSEAAEEAGIRYFSTRGEFVHLFETKHLVSQGFANTEPGLGHINNLGHAVVATRLSEMIVDQLSASTK